MHNQVPLATTIQTVSQLLVWMVKNGKITSILVDINDHELVQLAADLLKTDIEKVTSSSPKLVFNSDRISENVIIIGSVGSKYIQQLAKNHKIEIGHVKDKWESYSFRYWN